MTNQSRVREKLFRVLTPEALLYALAALATGILFLRPYYGRGFGEEAFFYAVAHRFYLGDRLFIDELNPCQTTALFFYPLHWLKQIILPGTVGLVLFQRSVAAVSVVGFAAIVSYYFQRLTATKLVSVTAFAFVISFTPFNFGFASHAILGERFLMTGLFTLFFALWSQRFEGGLVFGAAVCNVLGAICYPPLIYAAVAAGAALIFLSPKRSRIRNTGIYLLVSLAILGSLFFYARYVNYPSRLNELMATFGPRNFTIRILNLVLIRLPKWWCLAPLLGLSFFTCRRWPQYRDRILTLALISLFFLTPATNFLEQNWLLALGLASFALYLLVEKRHASRLLFWLVAFPSLIAMLATNLLSNAGSLMGGFGLLPAALSALLLLHWLYESNASKGFRKVFVQIIFTFLTSVNIFMQIKGFPFANLRTSAMGAGPNQGVLVSVDESLFDSSLNFQLNELQKKNRTLVSFPPDSLDYLHSNLLPLTPTVLSAAKILYPYLLQSHLANIEKIDVVVRRSDEYCDLGDASCAKQSELQIKFDQELARSFNLVAAHAWAKIFERKKR